MEEVGERPPVTRRDIPGCDAFILDNVFSEEECAILREQTENVGYSFWDCESNNPATNFRTAYTLEVHHEKIGQLVWSRIAPFCKDVEIGQELEDERWEMDIEGRWEPCGINDTLLFARYKDGGHFAVHSDGCSVYSLNERTFYSSIIYLNEPKDGGQTVIYRDEMRDAISLVDEGKRLRGRPEHVIESVQAKPGRMLIFYHRLLHEGVPADNKYIIRTDVVYRRTPAIHTEPKDLEAFQLYLEAQLLAEKNQCQEAMLLFNKCFRMSPNLAKLYKW